MPSASTATVLTDLMARRRFVQSQLTAGHTVTAAFKASQVKASLAVMRSVGQIPVAECEELSKAILEGVALYVQLKYSPLV